MMKKITLIVLSFIFAQFVVAQNSCSEALAVSVNVYSVSGIDESEIPLPVCSSGGTGATGGAWYSYTSSEDVLLTITTDLPGTGSTDTRVQVYTGVCGDLTCVAGDDDGGSGYTSLVNMQADAGVTYYIAFDNRYSSGPFEFEIIENEIIENGFGFTAVPISTIGSNVCAVDMNGDLLDDIVSTNSSNVKIEFQQANGTFAATTFPTATVPSASWSIAAGDIDGNGYNDLVYGNGQAVSFVTANSNGSVYTAFSFPEYVFSQRTNFVDINMDGNLDAFVCHDVDPNVYYINDGSGNLTYNQGGLGDTPQGGNYGSIWIDYDNDCDIDLWIAKCGSDPINQMHRNNGDGTFTSVADEIGLFDNGQTWSCAWGDYDNDGDMDLFIGASSGSHKMMMNMGDGTFTNITAGSGFDIFGSTSIDWFTHDFDNDGYLDIMGGGNVVMFNQGDFTFVPTAVQVSNGAVGDMNNDGFLDIVRSTNIYYNNGNDNNYIKINTKGILSNSNGIGARVEIISNLGTQIRDVKSGDGFHYMSSLNTHFGLAQDTEVEKITVCWPSGLVTEVLNPPINTLVIVEEEATTVGLEEAASAELVIFPNPVKDVLYLSSTENIASQVAVIYDVTGKMALQETILNNEINVSKLVAGVYFLQVLKDGKTVNQKFIKQ